MTFNFILLRATPRATTPEAQAFVSQASVVYIGGIDKISCLGSKSPLETSFAWEETYRLKLTLRFVNLAIDSESFQD